MPTESRMASIDHVFENQQSRTIVVLTAVLRPIPVFLLPVLKKIHCLFVLMPTVPHLAFCFPLASCVTAIFTISVNKIYLCSTTTLLHWVQQRILHSCLWLATQKNDYVINMAHAANHEIMSVGTFWLHF